MEIFVRNSIKKWAYASLKYLGILMLLALLVATGVSCGDSSSKVSVSSSTLAISPSNVVPGQPVTIAVNVLNNSKKPVDAYKVDLLINDAVVQTKNVSLPPGQATTITFEYTPNSTGSYNIDINGQTGSFSVSKPAFFKVTQLTVTPQSLVIGEEITLKAEIKNEGELSGTYQALFKVNGKDLNAKDLVIEAGKIVTHSSSYKPETNGTYLVQLGDVTSSITVLKPAKFEASSVSVSPGSIYVGQTAVVSAKITNSGEVKGEFPVALMANDMESSLKTITLEAGASSTIELNFTPKTSGAYTLKILGSSASMSVTALSSFTHGTYYYDVSYPPDYSINKVDVWTTSFEKSGIGGISVLTDLLAVSSTPDEYFNVIAKSKKQRLPDWTYTSRTEVKENGVVIGYRYDYTNTIDGQKWIGKGLILKKGTVGFYVVYTTKEPFWEQNKNIAPLVLYNFKTPPIYTGQYSNLKNGVTLNLPADWSIIETDDSTKPFVLCYPVKEMTGNLIVETVSSGTNTQKFVAIVNDVFQKKGWSLNNNGAFTFNNSAVGYEANLSGMTQNGPFKIRLVSLFQKNKMYTFMFAGPATDMESPQTAVTNLIKSLVVSDTSSLGLNKNETLYFLKGEVPTLDPALTEEAADGITGAIFSGLVRIDQNLKVVPDLAEKWTVSLDGKVYTFTLRKNAKFHSGKQVTAADVKYSWERACQPYLKAPKAMYFLNDIVGAQDMLDGKAPFISGIKVIDDYTLEVTIDAAKQYFLAKISQPIAFIVNRANVSPRDKWYESPDGTGPYTLKSWDKNTVIILTRNETFYEGPVKVKNLVFRLFAGLPMTLYANGEIDVTGVAYTDQDRVLNPADSFNKELLQGNVSSIDYLGFNVTKPPFDDAKVREAFALALDVNKLIQVTIKSTAVRAAGYVPEIVPGFNKSLQPFEYNIERAKQLLKESKYGGAAGLPSITLTVPYGTTAFEDAMIGMWQQNLGVQIKVEKITEVQTYMDRMRAHDFQLFVGGWRADYLDPQNFLEVLFKTGSTENHFAYSNQQVDDLLVRAGIESNADIRLQKYQDIEKLILADMPAVPLYRNSTEYVLVKPRVKGYMVLPMGISQWRELYFTP